MTLIVFAILKLAEKAHKMLENVQYGFVNGVTIVEAVENHYRIVGHTSSCSAQQ